MAEWLKAHAWKACVRETVPWVRIPLSPPNRANSRNDAPHCGRRWLRLDAIRDNRSNGVRVVTNEDARPDNITQRCNSSYPKIMTCRMRALVQTVHYTTGCMRPIRMCFNESAGRSTKCQDSMATASTTRVAAGNSAHQTCKTGKTEISACSIGNPYR
jgi:hypothetical protein